MMNAVRRFISRGTPLFVVAGSLAVASCNGSSSTTPVAPATASVTTALPSAGGTVTLASVGGYTPALQFAAGAPAGTTVTATSSLNAPANAPAPSAHARTVRGLANASPIFYLTVTVSQNVPTSVFSGETLGLPSTPVGVAYYLEIDDTTSAPATKLTTLGPATVSGGVATISNSSGGGGNNGPSTVAAGHTYLFMFYTLPAGTTPTASPSTTPSTSPSTAPSTSPSTTPSSSPSTTPSSSPSTTPSSSPSSSPSNTPKTSYTFSGSNASATFTSSGGTLNLPVTPYGVSSTSQWGSNNASGNVSFTGALASGKGDISPTGFATYTGSGNVVTYIKFTATPDTTFTTTPNFTVSVSNGGTFGGTTCNLYTQNYNGGQYVWQQALGPAAVSGSSVNFPAQTLTGGRTVSIGSSTSSSSQNGDSYLALVCQ